MNNGSSEIWVQKDDLIWSQNQEIELTSEKISYSCWVNMEEYGELNQTKLISFCGLNMKKHKEILEDMEKKQLISKVEEPWGSKTIVKYKVAPKG